MMLPDVNVLIYAFRQDAQHHVRCKTFLQHAVDGEANFGISPLTLSAVVRVTTNPRSYKEPSTPEEVFRFCDYLIESTNCRLIEPGERHWDIFKRLCTETDTRGPLVTDAWFAALAIEAGCEWITLDRDYARFPGLRWRVPDVP